MAEDEGMRRWLLVVFVAVQVGVPTAVLAVRVATGARVHPWGWQMFS